MLRVTIQKELFPGNRHCCSVTQHPKDMVPKTICFIPAFGSCTSARWRQSHQKLDLPHPVTFFRRHQTHKCFAKDSAPSALLWTMQMDSEHLQPRLCETINLDFAFRFGSWVQQIYTRGLKTLMTSLLSKKETFFWITFYFIAFIRKSLGALNLNDEPAAASGYHNLMNCF